MKQGLHRKKKRQWEKADGSIVGATAVAVCPAIALVCGTWRGHQSRPSHDRLLGDEDLFSWF